MALGSSLHGCPLYFDPSEVRILTDEWIEEYNHKRPHGSLGNMIPFEWKMNIINAKTLK
ncbi:MAG: transposase [Bacteroidetes bacterium]|nr:transposase [Bacteroidota bacterium]